MRAVAEHSKSGTRIADNVIRNVQVRFNVNIVMIGCLGMSWDVLRQC